MENNGQKILSTFLRRLTNLTGNNRSLLLLRLAGDQLMDLHELSFLNGERSFAILEALIAGKSKKICAVLDSRMESANVASKKLKKLARADQFIFEERGSKDLHVGWPMLRGKFSDGTLVRGPLLFFPVSLSVESDSWKLSLRKDAGITFNKSLILAYAYYNKVQVSEELLETTFEEFDSDSTAFRTQLYQLLSGNIELNFNRENFGDELFSFTEFKRKEFEEIHKDGELKLFPEAVLGIFPQAGSQLVPDYLKLIEDNRFSDLEDFFSSKNLNNEKDIHWTSVKEENIYTPLSMDVYQEDSIRLVKSGNSVVVHGPPGTGKSQLIGNLLADAIASGRTALLVCQKRVALDVVYNRLEEMKLGDFLGLVHDFRNDRKSIYEKIARQVETIENYRTRNRNVDIIHLERRFNQVCRQIDQVTEELEEFRKWLFDESECGISAKELYLTSAPHDPVINVRQEYQYFNFLTIHETLTRLRQYTRYASELTREGYPWRDRVSFSKFSLSDLREIENVLDDIPQFMDSVRKDLNKIIQKELDFDDCLKLQERQQDAEEMLGLLKSESIFSAFVRMTEFKDDDTSLLWLQNMERVCMNCFDGAGVESTLTNAQLGTCQLVLNERMRARKSLFRLIRWELFSEHRFFLKRVLIGNNLSYNKEGLKILEQRLDNRQNLEHHLTAIRERKWLSNLPTEYDQQKLRTWFSENINAIKAKSVYGTLRELAKGLHLENYDHPGFQETIRSVFAIIGKVPFHVNDWNRYLSSYQVREITSSHDVISKYRQSLRKDFDKLCEFDRLRDSMPSVELEVLNKLHDEVGDWEMTQIENLFQNSVRMAWIEHLEMKHPVLRTVSTHRMDELQEQLQLSAKEKMELSKEITLLRARERTYESIEYNRLNNPVTYCDLHHQVTKKRKIWPIRKVMSQFSGELFNLVPCWLASPESVSAIFPMEQLFDLVIFDEASQCFSERGIPAMYRGKQIIVAGDEKQLKPFELYQVRWDEEYTHPDEEVDSLLELSKRYLPSSILQGHYRSVSNQLIEFSNTHFYKGKLKLLPDRLAHNQKEPFINYLKIDGVWKNQTNENEALAVVQKIKEIMEQQPSKEIGVVTFNAPQQELIQDLLDEEKANGLKIPESFFVKNIENVQGDERDIIIFSIGYAPDEKGKMNLQFGSLSVSGGENRLNVAVTRAREKVIVIASIWPEELKSENVRNEGPKLLQAYLAYARDISEGNFNTATYRDEDHRDEWYLHSQIQKWCEDTYPIYKFEGSKLPFASAVVTRNNESLGLLLTDDDKYKNCISVKEHHAYTPELLHNKRWKYRYVYSRNWWISKADTKESLAKFVYQADEFSTQNR